MSNNDKFIIDSLSITTIVSPHHPNLIGIVVHDNVRKINLIDIKVYLDYPSSEALLKNLFGGIISNIIKQSKCKSV